MAPPRSIDSTEAKRISRIRWDKYRERKLVQNDPTGTLRQMNRRLTKKELDAAYVSRAFPEPWDEHYRQACRRLKKQYAPRGVPAVQYEMLLRHAAAVDTLILQLETAKKPDRYLILKQRDQLRDLIAQLQRYTESEKRELVIQEEVLVTTLTKVIAIADSTILDPAQRGAFLRALRIQIGDDTVRTEVDDLTRGLPILDVARSAES